MILKEDREKFVNNMKIKLELNNYGFQLSKTKQGISINNGKKCKAIQELLIRMNIWYEIGKKDQGEIDFIEANRKICYILDDNDIKKCKIAMLVK